MCGVSNVNNYLSVLIIQYTVFGLGNDRPDPRARRIFYFYLHDSDFTLPTRTSPLPPTMPTVFAGEVQQLSTACR